VWLLKKEGFEKKMGRASPQLPDTEGGVVRPTGSKPCRHPIPRNQTSGRARRLHVKAGNECISMTARGGRSPVMNLGKRNAEG
jgi:hypothetical protein